MKRTLITSAAIAVLLTAGVTGVGYATGGDDCVPAVAYVEVIEHPAVTHVVPHDAVAAVPGAWWNWSPNKDQGPFDGPPDFPTDPRGTWNGPHTEGGPSADLTGTFQQGNGHGSWFHREQGTPGSEAWDETVVDAEAWTEYIEHDAVTCPEDPEDPPTDEPTDNPTEDPTREDPSYGQTTHSGPVPVPSAVDAGQ